MLYWLLFTYSADSEIKLILLVRIASGRKWNNKNVSTGQKHVNLLKVADYLGCSGEHVAERDRSKKKVMVHRKDQLLLFPLCALDF